MSSSSIIRKRIVEDLENLHPLAATVEHTAMQTGVSACCRWPGWTTGGVKEQVQSALEVENFIFMSLPSERTLQCS
jgi:hypothetical protein